MALCDQNPYSGGGFGDVHQGVLLDGTKVALKCVRLYINKSKDYCKEFKYAARELHTWSKCQNPNVVKLLGLAEFRGKIAMVSPWMEQGSVNYLDSSDDRIDRCQLCIGVARGLAYLHETNIVHGDLKGGNVLLSNNGEAQLADFGNAVFAGSALLFTESTSTRSGFSVRWAAPEQLLDEVLYSRQADIYSLWMTILEIISRQVPYAEIKNEAAVITIILKPQHPKRPGDTIPVESKQGNTLWSLLKTCWSRDPEDRPEAGYVVSVIGMIGLGDLLVESPETNINLSSLESAQNSSAPEKKRRLETLERGAVLWEESLLSEMDIPITYQQLIGEATELLNDVPPRTRQRMDDSPAEPTPKPHYSVDDMTDLLSKMRKLGVNTPERARLELLDQQVRDFQQRARGLLHMLEDSEDMALLAKFEELAAIGRGYRLRLDELTRLDRFVARLQFLLQAAKDSNPTLEYVEELILRGQAAGVPPDHRAMVELTRRAMLGREWKLQALSIIQQRRPTMRDLDQLMVPEQGIPTSPNVLARLEYMQMKGREHEKEVEAHLRPPKGMLVLIDDADKLADAALRNVFFPAAEELRALSTEARMWEKTWEEIMTGRFKAQGNATVFDEVRAMRNEGKSKFWAFQTPWFDMTVNQLEVHDDWISQLPWTRRGLPVLELNTAVDDLTGDGDAECVPPTNEACMCICLEPVVVDGSAQGIEVAQRDHCLVRFHTECIEGLCPFCHLATASPCYHLATARSHHPHN
ncbi:hypothetical protein FRC12_010553 [Ceratobasidium sp. 428]|nr:hypothetical protein FRC12_010553 [Ceratobasidium sp. 428]